MYFIILASFVENMVKKLLHEFLAGTMNGFDGGF